MLNKEKQLKLKKVIIKESSRELSCLTLGYLRYEILRRLSPSEYKKLHEKNLAGERFDNLVDDLVIEFYA